MQKNNFMKNVLALMMMLAMSMSMTSCQGFVDAVFGSEDNPVEKPETTEETESSTEVKANGTTITIASGDEIEDALTEAQAKQMIEAIKASAAKNEEYTITIMSEDPLDAANFGFEVPSIAKANINLVFDCDIESSEDSPLVIDSESKSKTSTDAINELTITLPDGADDVYLSINTPETTVTLTGNVTYSLVEAITATETLIVGEGVVIENLTLKGGSVEIQDGGTIETLNVKNTKELTKIMFDEEDSKGIIEELVIADGASVNFNVTTPNIKAINGQGEAAIRYGTFNESTGEPENGEIDLKNIENLSGVALSPLKEVEYMNDDNSMMIYNIPDNTQDCSFKAFGIYYFGNNIKDCSFEIGWWPDYFNETMEGCSIKVGSMSAGTKTASVTFKNCEIEVTEEEPVHFGVSGQTEGNSSFTLNFENCELSERGNKYIRIEPYIADSAPILDENGEYVRKDVYCYRLNGETINTTDFNSIPEEIRNQGEQTIEIAFDSDNPQGYYVNKNEIQYESVEYDNFVYRINLKNCTIGGSKATPDMIVIWHYWIPSGTKCYYNIDGVDYVVAKDNKGFYLTPANASTRAFGAFNW